MVNLKLYLCVDNPHDRRYLYADKTKEILTKKTFLEADRQNGKGARKQPESYAGDSCSYQQGGTFKGQCVDVHGENRRYTVIMELDKTVLNRLINRILIEYPKKIDGVRTQEIRIIYNFVGELWNEKATGL